MQPWAVIAEWVKGTASFRSPWNPSEPRAPHYRANGIQSLSKGLSENNEFCEDIGPYWFRALLNKSQRRRLRILRKSCVNPDVSVSRERYRKTLDRGLQLGHEVNLENEDDGDDGRNWTVSYQSIPLRNRELLVNDSQEQTVRISWSSEHKGDTALMAYNYDSLIGHTANWMVSGSGGPISITSRGELTESEFEQENDVKLRSNIRSHPIETDVNGTIRINYLTDNVDFRWKAAVKYPFMKKSFKISHGLERQELFGCCWTVKAERTSEELPLRAVKMETTGTMTGTGTPSRIEHFRAELVRNLIGAYNVEVEAKTPFLHRGIKWASKLRHKNEKGTECVASVEGENNQVREWSMRCSYKPVKDAGISMSAMLRPEEGWGMSTSLKLGPQDSNDANQRWNVRGELNVSDGFRSRQANVDLFIPVRFPAAFSL